MICDSFVNYVEIFIAIDSDIVSGLPFVFIRKLWPVVDHFVAMLAGTDDELLLGFLSRENARRGEGSGGERGVGKKLTTTKK